MNTTSKRWFALALLVGAAVLGFVLAPSPEVGALPPFTKLTDYYTDATYTTETGAFCFRSCNGSLDCEGTPTSYWVREFDYWCIGSSYCCIICSTGSCPPNVLSNYPCPEC